ncbi:hypothetical protein PHLGIDRAFT_109756 [Phlebiopsis gigantea 11061_1 CR5-6]|uniref:GDT1 family protein n=1 Tax=Phlebiopsis gigantea (strain 11061_1 CR5-6) TaxID=745531 RepID=A0A0C3RTZ8_PHLG1|nr:hypothetical protein PHLGIDRAFT_109756 [Phlebiopsis gigantea 11061_1 CR5-6]
MAADAAVPVAGDESELHALLQSFAMIIVSEIGDKTFLIAAILAMRHPRGVVFAGAFGSLAVMSVLSASLGHLLPTLIPRRWTQALAAVLFLVFGYKMLQEAREMRPGSDKIREEMKEAEEEIEESEAAAAAGHALPLEALEEGGRAVPARAHARTRSQSTAAAATHSLAQKARNYCSVLLGPHFTQAFLLTFLGEWGDRSQIATIALGAAHNVYLVTLGTIVGHGCCTALAVVGGRYVSTKISVKHVTLAGSALFILFGLIYFYEAFHSIDIDVSDITYPA